MTMSYRWVTTLCLCHALVAHGGLAAATWEPAQLTGEGDRRVIPAREDAAQRLSVPQAGITVVEDDTLGRVLRLDGSQAPILSEPLADSPDLLIGVRLRVPRKAEDCGPLFAIADAKGNSISLIAGVELNAGGNPLLRVVTVPDKSGPRIHSTLMLPEEGWCRVSCDVDGGFVTLSVENADGQVQSTESRTAMVIAPWGGKRVSFGRFRDQALRTDLAEMKVAAQPPARNLSVRNNRLAAPNQLPAERGRVPALPTHWTIDNHPVPTVESLAAGTPLSVVCRNGLTLVKPDQAVVSQRCGGRMEAGLDYTLAYSVWRGRGPGSSSVHAELQVDGRTVAEEMVEGDAVSTTSTKRTLTYRSTTADFGKPAHIRFTVTSPGDLSLDAINITAVATLDPAFVQKLETLTAQVAALPRTTTDQRLKHAALALALEQAKTYAEARATGSAQDLLNDVAVSLPKDLGAAKADPAKIPWLPPLRTVEGNPYLDELYAWGEAFVQQPEAPFLKNTPDYYVFDPARNQLGRVAPRHQMQYLLWLAGHSQSRVRNDPELFTRLMRRCHAYIDAIEVHGHKGAKGEDVYSFFFAADAAFICVSVNALWPDLLLPSQRATWDRAIRHLGDLFLTHTEERKLSPHLGAGLYANLDMGYGATLQSCGMWLKEAKYLDAARFLMRAQDKSLYPDGAWAYIGTQNEGNAYHDADVDFMTRYWLLSGDENVKSQLLRSQWYGPVTFESSGVMDAWTEPSWKQKWNGNSGGGEAIAGLSGNPWMRTLLDPSLPKPQPGKFDLRTRPNYWGAQFYDKQVKARPLPDGYTIYDRNIQGPRGRYGRFSYASSTRVPHLNNQEPGKTSLIGAMISERKPDIFERVPAAITMAMPRVLTKADPKRSLAWCWLTTDDINTVTTGQQFSALSSSYALHQPASSSKGPVVPWCAFQAWIGIRNHLFGLIELRPEGVQQVAAAVTTFRFNCLAGLASKDRAVERLADDRFALNDLELRLRGHNYPAVLTLPEVGDQGPNRDVVLSDVPAIGTTMHEVPADRVLWSVVEIKPKEVADALAVERLTVGDATGLRVQGKGERFVLWRNRGTTPVTIPLAADRLPGVTSSLHRSRAAAVPPVSPAPADVVIPPGEQVVLIVSPDAALHAAGWESFSAMVGMPSHP